VQGLSFFFCPKIFNCTAEYAVEPTVLFDLNRICQLCASYDVDVTTKIITSIDEDADLVAKVLTVMVDSEVKTLTACPKCIHTIQKWLLFRRKCLTAKELLSTMTGLNCMFEAQKLADVKYVNDEEIDGTQSGQDNEMVAADFSSAADESEQDTKPLQIKKKKKRPPHVKVTRCLDCDKV
jgi:hypothetical protein